MMNKKSVEIMESLVELLKEELLNDEEFIDKLRDKLGKVEDEEQEGTNGEESEEENEDEEGNEGDGEGNEAEENEEEQGYQSGKFILTNGNGDIIIDEDGDEFEINAKEEVQDSEATEFGKEGVGVEVIEDIEEDTSTEEEYENEANWDFDEEKFKEQLVKTLEQQLDESVDIGDMEDIQGMELDIEGLDDPELLEKLKELLQQQSNFKFREREVDEYNAIIDSVFANFPTDLGGNDEL